MLRELLRGHADAIAGRWFTDGLAAYAPEASALFAGQSDRFANPVGHSLRAGTTAILEALIEEADADAVRPSLEAIVAIRAVQEFPPSRALAFVFGLKRAVRSELGDAVRDPRLHLELEALDTRIDAVALLAFDAYVACRERVAELRIRELKRNIPWATGRAAQFVQIGEPG
ncbi:MAG TPA: RsbRD N-terminal domain-containing protein [Longimicrobiales bacterium]|nr:RsbRD N-terminal domain-containing protein [Longimicrobiales bacterium]